MDKEQRREILLGNLRGMLDLRYKLHGLSQGLSDPEGKDPEHWEGWERLNKLDVAEIDTLREAIKFVEAQPVKKLIVPPYLS